MDRHQKLLRHILTRKGDANVPFQGLCGLLRRLGFEERIRGDHHIFSMAKIEEIINIKPRDTKAKPYQVKQVRASCSVMESKSRSKAWIGNTN